MDAEKQDEELTIAFDVKPDTGNRNRVDAVAVGKAVIAADAILRELHEEFRQNSEILVKARPFKQGSFEIPIDVTIVLLGALTSFSILEDMLRCLTEYFRFKRELKGLAPQIQDGKLIIENNRIAIDKIVLNLLDPTNTSNKLMGSAFEEIEKDANITGFRVTRKTCTLAKVKREEFKYYGPPAREKMLKKVEITEVLEVLGPMFDEEHKWIFRRKGKPIHANIADERFLKETVIENGESFRSGDKLRVDLIVEQEYNEVAAAYVDKTHTVVRILKHIKRTETGELFPG